MHKTDMRSFEKSPGETFTALKDEFFAAIKTHPEVLDKLRSFKSSFNTAEDARQLVGLIERGADKLEIRVGKLPLAIGPGLAYMYDLVIEAIHRDPGQLDARSFNARALRTAVALFDVGALSVGAFTVKALGRALTDERYADRLRDRAGELGWIALDNPPPPGTQCEFCTVVVDDNTGNPEITCPSKEECEAIGGSVLLLILLLILTGLLGWLLE